MTSNRRRAPENSASRVLLMDAVEQLMREKGYGALTVRGVAQRAGLNYQLVFYYFEGMDDLLLTTYRRRTQTVLEKAEQAIASETPLHSLWDAASEPSDAALTIEYMALSNHNHAIRAETIAFGERLRRTVAEKLAVRWGGTSQHPEALTPAAISLAVNHLGALLGFEHALGIAGGHAEAKALVNWCLGRLE